MKKIYSLMFAMGAVCAASLTSCSSDSTDAEYVAVKESRSGNWSFYSPDGDVICKDEFKSEPSPVINGYFYVPEGNNGLYTLYKIGEKPEAVKDCDGLVDVGYMSEGIVPVVKKNARISFVDKNGEVKFTLEPVGGKEIREAQSYVSDGLIAIENEEGKCGYVNTKGETVIELKYDGAMPFREGLAVVGKTDKDGGFGSFLVIDKKGETVFKLKDGYLPSGVYYEGYLLSTDANGQYVLLDKKGEQVYKFKDGVRVKAYNKKYAYIYNSDGYGIMSLEGEMVIKPGKFSDFQFVGDDKFLAYKDRNTVLLDADGEEVKDFDGRVRYNKKFGFYNIGSSTTTFIDEDGKDKKDASFFRLGDFEIGKITVRSAHRSKEEIEAVEAPVVEEVVDSVAEVVEY
ncbi:MAG: WG repeat-containing protein [Muribaculaceae bacterium]